MRIHRINVSILMGVLVLTSIISPGRTKPVCAGQAFALAFDYKEQFLRSNMIAEVGYYNDFPDQKDYSWRLKGYYKNLAMGSETIDGRDYFVDLNRLRLELTGTWREMLSLRLIYDHEGLLGNYLHTDEFRQIKSAQDQDILDLTWDINDGRDFFWRHTFYRGFLKYESERLNITLGRQRIAWGTGRFWNPTDIFNPFNPLQVERDERTGVDALNLEWFLGPLSSASLVYAPQTSSHMSKAAAKFKTTVSDVDLSLMGGKFRRDAVLGFDFSGTIKGGGIRGEGTFTFAYKRSDYARFVLSYDYAFRNTFYILLEYFYNGGPFPQFNLIDFTRELATLKRNFLGSNLGYDITPLLRADVYLIYDFDGSGIFIYPNLQYSITSNTYVSLGAQLFKNRKNSEFEFYKDLYFLQLQYFF